MKENTRRVLKLDPLRFCSLLPAAVIITAALLCFAGEVHAASCELNYNLKFKPRGEFGTPSYITSPGTRVPYRLFVSMPPVILSLKYQTATASLIDPSLDGTVVQAVPVPDSMRLGGDTVQLFQGIASFQSLQVQSVLPGEVYRIMFVISVPNGTTSRILTVSTGNLSQVTNPDHNRVVASLRFGSFGWLFPARTSRTLPDGVTPPFIVELVDPLGFVSTASANVTVLFVSATATALRPNSVICSPSRFTALSGSAVISFSVIISGTPPAEALLNITVFDGTRTHFLQSDKLRLNALTIPPALPNPLPNYFIGFDPVLSSFPYENIGNTAVIGVPLPPVVIRMYTSQFLADTSSSGQFVFLASAEGATLRGNAALVLNGVATFTDLVFTGPSTLQSAIITFTCNQPLEDDPVPTLYSGSISVSVAPIKSTHIVFHEMSQLQSSAPNSVVLGQDLGSFQIQGIIVQMKDSAYQSDYSATGGVFRLSAPLLNFSLGTVLVATMVDGIAVFTDINVVGCSPSCTTGGPFTIIITGPSYVQSTLTAEVSPIAPLPPSCTVALDVLGADSCRGSASQYVLEFLGADESFVHGLEQPIFGTVGSPFPEIRLALRSQADFLVDLEATSISGLTLYAYTDSLGGPSAEKLLSTIGGAHIGVWKGRYWAFGCLLFAAAPSGLPKLQFGFGRLNLTTGKIDILASPVNQTGFVTVIANPTSNYGLRFAADWSHVQYEGQSTSGVLFVTLPTIQLQIVDSLHALDTSGIDIVVSATASGGDLVTGGSVTFVSGVANFSSLRFQTVVSNPIITFTVSHAAVYPVAGSSVSTGPISLTATYIRNYHIRFKRLSSCQFGSGVMCVVRNNQPFSFPDINSVRVAATIIVEDSSHEQQQRDPTASTDAEQSVTVEASSYEATVDTSAASSWTTTFVTSSEGSLVLSLSAFRSAYAATKPPIYIRVVVTGGAPTLVGRALVIGPITVGGAGGSCTTSLNAPLVVANFYQSLANFTTSINRTIASVAQLLGIEEARVHIKNYSATVGIEPSTRRRWSGTKATLQFDDPTTTSANRASSATLASQFVALRPDCQKTPLPLANIYVENPNYGCNPTLFNQGVSLAQQCAVNGDSSQCACYNTFLIDPYGLICADDQSVRTTFIRQCELLSTCLENSIQSVCSQILVSQGNRYIWAFGAFGGIVGLGLFGYFLAKKVVFKTSKVTLSRQDK